ncbi:cation transporter [bacterium]|nr:cation transporter [bacterium]
MKNLYPVSVQSYMPRNTELNVRQPNPKLFLLLVLTGTALFIAKIFLGLRVFSISMLADGLMTAAFLLDMINARIRPSSPGRQRFKYETAIDNLKRLFPLAIAVFLAAGVFELFREAIRRFMQPDGIRLTHAALWSFIGIAWVQEAVFLLSGKRMESDRSWKNCIRACFPPHRISILLVLVNLIALRSLAQIADPVAACLIGILILSQIYTWIYHSLYLFFGTDCPGPLKETVTRAVSSLPDVQEVHDILIHPGILNQTLSFHVGISEEATLRHAYLVSEQAEKAVFKKIGIHSVVSIDPINTHDPEIKKIRHFLIGQVRKRKQISAFFNLHIEQKEGARYVFFDLQVEPGEYGTAETAKEQMRAALLRAFPDLAGVVIEMQSGKNRGVHE